MRKPLSELEELTRRIDQFLRGQPSDAAVRAMLEETATELRAIQHQLEAQKTGQSRREAFMKFIELLVKLIASVVSGGAS